MFKSHILNIPFITGIVINKKLISPMKENLYYLIFNFEFTLSKTSVSYFCYRFYKTRQYKTLRYFNKYDHNLYIQQYSTIINLIINKICSFIYSKWFHI